MPYTNHSVLAQITSVSSQQAPAESPVFNNAFFLLQYHYFSGALEDSRQGKSFSWETLCQSSRPRPLLWSSPHECRTWTESLSGAPAVFRPLHWSLVYSYSSLQDLVRFLYWAVAIEMKLGQLVFPDSVHPSVKLSPWAVSAAGTVTPASPLPLTPLAIPQQHRKDSWPPPQPCSAFPTAGSHTSQSTQRAAPRGDSKSRQTLWQLPANLVYMF